MNNDISLRPVQISDLDKVLGWRNDKRIRQHMFNSNLIKQEDHRAWFKKVSSDPNYHVLMVLRANIPFGFAQLQLSRCSTIADWGFYVDPDGPAGQGKALGRVVLSYGFEHLSLHRITGRVLSENLPSINFHRHLGFVDEGILRLHHYTKNGYQDVCLFGLLSDEWTVRCVTSNNKARNNGVD